MCRLQDIRVFPKIFAHSLGRGSISLTAHRAIAGAIAVLVGHSPGVDTSSPGSKRGVLLDRGVRRSGSGAVFIFLVGSLLLCGREVRANNVVDLIQDLTQPATVVINGVTGDAGSDGSINVIANSDTFDSSFITGANQPSNNFGALTVDLDGFTGGQFELIVDGSVTPLQIGDPATIGTAANPGSARAGINIPTPGNDTAELLSNSSMTSFTFRTLGEVTIRNGENNAGGAGFLSTFYRASGDVLYDLSEGTSVEATSTGPNGDGIRLIRRGVDAAGDTTFINRARIQSEGVSAVQNIQIENNELFGDIYIITTDTSSLTSTRVFDGISTGGAFTGIFAGQGSTDPTSQGAIIIDAGGVIDVADASFSMGIWARMQGGGNIEISSNADITVRGGDSGASRGILGQVLNSQSLGAIDIDVVGGRIDQRGGGSAVEARHEGLGDASIVINGDAAINTIEDAAYGAFALVSNASSLTGRALVEMNGGSIETGGAAAHALVAGNFGAGDAAVIMSGGSVSTLGSEAHGVYVYTVDGGDARFEMSSGEVDAGGVGALVLSQQGVAEVMISGGSIISGSETTSAAIRTIAPGGASVMIGGGAFIDGSASGMALMDGDFDLAGNDLVGGDAVVRIDGNATIIGDVLLGGGSDLLTIAGAVDLSEVNGLNGGVDASIVNGTDVLTFEGRMGSLAGIALDNWSQIILDDGSDMAVGPALTVGVDGLGIAETGMGLFVESGSTLRAGGGLELTGNLINRGTVSMVDGVEGDVLSVSGDYRSNSTLEFDVNFATATADTLVIAGDVLAGSEADIVANVVGGPGTGETVRLITVGGDNNGDYILVGGPIQSGVWTYDLLADQNVDLVAQINSLGSVYESAPAIILGGFGALPTLEQRVGERRGADQGEGLWVRWNGERNRVTPHVSSSDSSFRSTNTGVQLGWDFFANKKDAGFWVFGLTGQYNEVSANISSQLGSGRLSGSGYGVGATATWYGENGNYLDLQAQANWVAMDYSTAGDGSLAKNRKALVIPLSAEVGHRYFLGDEQKHTLVPQAQLSWGRVRVDSFVDRLANEVRLGTGKQTLGRLGLAYEYRPSGLAERFSESDEDLKLYGILNLLHSHPIAMG